MSITINLSASVEAALRADAEAQGRPVDEVAAEALESLYHRTDEEDPEAVEAIGKALAAADADERNGRLLTVSEAFDGIRTAIKARGQRNQLKQEPIDA